jgi:hypothetical protein
MPNRLTAVLHPVQAWRAYAAAAADRADAKARAAGLTVEDLGRGVRRYRDPALDRLATHRAHLAAACVAAPYAEVRNGGGAAAEASGGAVAAGAWSTPTLTLAGWSR